ncbi:tetratricopeptide repeat protein [Flavobacterium sp.]|uniref:tetratricopeptide repeat protein n=1 Tax=Flavobacterium sp. TaxID=239 RepID=UPI00286C4AB5|nr:tetratricopeptide repeat protein [Flavobacterium sp.]
MKKNLLISVVIIIIFSINSYCQTNDSRKTFSTVICEYNLPLSLNGLSVSAFNVTPRIRIERYEKSAQIILDIDKMQGTASNPNPSFKHSYNYNGKQYGEQYVGYDPFKNIEAVRTSITFEVLVTYGSQSWGWKRVDGMTNQFGPINKDAKASDVMVNVRIVGIGGFTNTSEIENKIRELSKPQTTNSNPTTRNVTNSTNSNATKQQTNSIPNKTNSQTSNSNSESAKSNSTSNSNNQSTAITNMSDVVGLSDTKESIQVFQQNGSYYIKKQDGSTSVTTKQYYDQVQALSASNAQIKENNQKQLNDPLAHFETDGKTLTNPMATKTSTGSSAVDSFTKGYQQGQQIGEVANGIVDLFAKSPERVQAEKAEYERQKKLSDDIEGEKKEIRFGKLYYYPLIDKANNGDENARMILYFASYDLLCTQFIPKRKEWFNQAYKNKNLDAILYVARTNAAEGKEYIPLLQEAARLGSVDAMVELGKWFDSKSFTYSGVASIAGENPEKAIAAFTEAAEKGSPNASYYLGMIYKYGIIEDLSTGGIKNFRKKTHVTYAIAPDEKKAFEWFSKSLEPNYTASLFSIESWYMKGSYFESDCYLELADMYRKGKVVAKDKDKAKAYEKSHEEYNTYENEKKRRGF